MSDTVNGAGGLDRTRITIEIAIRLFFVAALDPWFDRLAALLGGRRKLAGALFIWPSWSP